MPQIKELIGRKESRFAFVTAVIMILIVHYYAFTNILINHDSVNYLLSGESIEYFFGCGRWFLYLVMGISSKITLPAVISMFCTISLAGTSVLIIDMFKIRSKWHILCLNFLLASFPVVGNLLCYIYSADGLVVAVFLGSLGAWLVLQKNRKLNILAIVVLVCTCGMHQSFWCMSLVLVYFCIFSQYLKDEVAIGDAYKRVISYFMIYAVSIITYLLVNKGILLFTGFEAVGYAGLDKMLDFGGVQRIVDSFYGANKQVFQFYFLDGNFIKSAFSIIVNILISLYLICFFIRKHYRKISKWTEWIMFAGVVLIAPSVLNCVEIASKGYFHTVMMMAFIVPYIVCISCLEVHEDEKKEKWQKAITASMLGLIFILGYTNYLTCNKMYTRQELNYEATYGYLNRMLMRIEENESYQQNPDVSICFVNNPPNEKEHVDILTQNYPEKLSVFDECNGMVGNNVHTMIKNTKDIYDFMEIFLGTELMRTTGDENVKIGKTQEFQMMPDYPDKGSMQLIEGILVIKLPDKIE